MAIDPKIAWRKRVPGGRILDKMPVFTNKTDPYAITGKGLGKHKAPPTWLATRNNDVPLTGPYKTPIDRISKSEINTKLPAGTSGVDTDNPGAGSTRPSLGYRLKDGISRMGEKVFSEENMNAVGSAANEAKPFMSNIMNAFRKPPMPKRGTPNPYTNLKRINLQEDRNAVSRGTAVANRATERNVDGNTAEAIKQFNRGTDFSKMTAITDREVNANAAIDNQQAVLDATTTAGNNAKIDKYQDEQVARGIAHQREQSANWANAGDKAALIRNEKEKGRVELEKARVLKSVYAKSGVLDRQQKLWDDEELDPFATKEKEKKKYGGVLKMRKVK